MLLLVGVWIFFMRQMQMGGGKAMSFGKSRARLLNENQQKITFGDVAGIDEAKEEVGELVEFLEDPSRFQKLGGRIPRGVMLIGPPGTGKTTTVISLAHCLAEAGRKVLVVDLDAQGNVNQSLGFESRKGLYDLLVDGVPLSDCVVEARENLYCLPSDQTVAACETILVSRPRREEALRRALNGVEEQIPGLEVVFLDCSPSLSILSQNALVYVDELLLPVSVDYLAMVVSTGIGAGIVLDGRLLDGADGNAGHIGHVVVEPGGRLCACGVHGCLEAVASGTALAGELGHPAAQAPIHIRERTGRYVGRGVAAVVNLLDLRLAVVAGSVALGFGDPFFAAANEELETGCGLEFTAGARIVPAGLGADGPLVGAAAVGLRGLGALEFIA
jgi:energy-coupling factor transporter ATP-binding protein EcfA2